MSRKTAILFVAVLCIFATNICVTAPVRVLFRSKFFDLSPQDRDEYEQQWHDHDESLKMLELTGHLAIEIPSDSWKGSTILGWQPMHRPEISLSDTLDFLARKNSAGRFNAVRGLFLDDEKWAEAGIESEVMPTFSIDIKVSAKELATILHNIENLKLLGVYQLIPDGRGYNSVTVLNQIFRGTQANLPPIPATGSIATFIAENRARTQYWQGNCATRVNRMNSF